MTFVEFIEKVLDKKMLPYQKEFLESLEQPEKTFLLAHARGHGRWTWHYLSKLYLKRGKMKIICDGCEKPRKVGDLTYHEGFQLCTPCKKFFEERGELRGGEPYKIPDDSPDDPGECASC